MRIIVKPIGIKAELYLLSKDGVQPFIITKETNLCDSNFLLADILNQVHESLKEGTIELIEVDHPLLCCKESIQEQLFGMDGCFETGIEVEGCGNCQKSVSLEGIETEDFIPIESIGVDPNGFIWESKKDFVGKAMLEVSSLSDETYYAWLIKIGGSIFVESFLIGSGDTVKEFNISFAQGDQFTVEVRKQNSTGKVKIDQVKLKIT